MQPFKIFHSMVTLNGLLISNAKEKQMENLETYLFTTESGAQVYKFTGRKGETYTYDPVYKTLTIEGIRLLNFNFSGARSATNKYGGYHFGINIDKDIVPVLLNDKWNIWNREFVSDNGEEVSLNRMYVDILFDGNPKYTVKKLVEVVGNTKFELDEQELQKMDRNLSTARTTCDITLIRKMKSQEKLDFANAEYKNVCKYLYFYTAPEAENPLEAKYNNGSMRPAEIKEDDLPF